MREMKPTVKSIQDNSPQHKSIHHSNQSVDPGVPVSSASITDRQIIIVLAALTAAIYLRTLAPDVLAGDAGEFHFAAWRLGLSHPTGYPTYLIVGHLWQKALAWVGISPALALNAFSAVVGALSLGMLYRLMRRWLPARDPATRGLSQAAALFTALLFGWNLTYWSQNLIAEVYTLHVVFLLAIFGVVTRLLDRPATAGPVQAHDAQGHTSAKPPARGLILLAALAGLSLTHHGMTLFLIPALLCYLFLAYPAWYRQLWRAWLGILAAGALPLLLYLYIPLRGGPDASPWYHQALGAETLILYAGDWDAFVQFVTGRSISVGFNTPAAAWEQLGFAAWLWRFHFTTAGLVVVGLGLFILFRRKRYAILALTGGYALTQQLFNLFYNIEDILVYYIPLYLMGAMWAGFGAHALATAAWRAGSSAPESLSVDPDHRTDRAAPSTVQGDAENTVAAPAGESPDGSTSAGPDPAPAQTDSTGQTGQSTGFRWSNRLGWVVMILLFLLPVTMLLMNMGLVDQAQSTTARAQWEAILAAEPSQNAILVSNDRDEIVPLFYVQWVEERRQDLTGLFPLIAPDARFSDIGTTLVTALAAARPGGTEEHAVYLIKAMPGLAIAFDLEPATPPLVHVRGRHASQPPIATEHRLGPLQLEGYAWTALDPAENAASANTESANAEADTGENLELRLYWRVVEPLPGDYTTTLQLFDAAGERIGQNDAPAGHPYYPTSLWKMGEQIIETHRLATPFDTTAPLLPDATLLIGMYSPGDLEQLAAPMEIGHVFGPTPDQ